MSAEETPKTTHDDERAQPCGVLRAMVINVEVPQGATQQLYDALRELLCQSLGSPAPIVTPQPGDGQRL